MRQTAALLFTAAAQPLQKLAALHSRHRTNNFVHFGIVFLPPAVGFIFGRAPSGAIGELSVIFRTQSAQLIASINEFLRLWVRLENIYISKLHEKQPVKYELYDGRFVRSLSLPENRDYNDEQLGEAISGYVSMFDSLLKAFLNNTCTREELENRYLAYLNRGIGII